MNSPWKKELRTALADLPVHGDWSISSASSSATSHASHEDLRSKAHVLGRLVASRIAELSALRVETRPGPIQLIDMFSGCGGMSAGFLAVNAVVPAYRLLGAIDIDSIANATYAKNIGIVPAGIDVARLARRPTLLRDFLDKIAYDPRKPLVMIGCAPCQGFSSHRNRRGARDPRNHLFLDFAAIVSRLRPVAAVMENVPELLTNRYWPLVARVRKKLESAGYVVRIAIINMATFGVPQERFRAVVLALRRPFLLPQGFLDRPNFQTVRQTIAALPKILPGERCPTDPMHFTAGHSASTVATISQVSKDGGRRPSGVGPECLRRIERKQGRSGYDDVYGRLYWDRPAITVTAYARNPASGRYVHPEQNRGLSVREAALLQAFPPDFHFQGTLDEKFKQIGNAVPPAFAGFVAAHLLGELIGPRLNTRAISPGITEPVGHSFSRLIPSIKAGTWSGYAQTTASD
jgi:DNA (cytosine-5)-methyltransferase 1